MTRLGWTAMLATGAFIVFACGLFIWHHARTEVTEEVETHASSTDAVNPSTLSIYTSGEYGFSVIYPSTATVSDAYTTTALSGTTWKTGATATGTPVVQIQSETEEIRIGFSSTAAAVRSCITAGPAEASKGVFQVGSTTWNTFTFQKVGTDNEQRVTSYRVVRNAHCYAFELFQPLSGIASSTSYTLGDAITSFSFAD